MKKYILALIATVLAITFSAFTATKQDSNTIGQATYKWYLVSYASPYQDNGAILASTDIRFGGVAQTQQYALDHDGCADSGSKNCVRGFSSGSEPTIFPSQSGGQVQTPKP